MSSPIAITASSSSLYIPVHRRSQGPPSSYASSDTSRASSPTSMHHTPVPGIYSPAELLSLADSPLAALSAGHIVDALRASAPEVVQSRKQRKALAWHARHGDGHDSQNHHSTSRHRRTASRGSHSTSESDEERTTSWRKL